MRPPLVVLGFVAFLGFSIAAHAADFIWPNHGTISFEVPAGWNLRGQPAGEAGFAFSAKPDSRVAAQAKITLAGLPPGKKIHASDLENQLSAAIAAVLPGSVEKKFRGHPLALRQGAGLYVELIDASLVGKPPVAGDYKVMRQAMLAPDENTLVIATLQFDDPAAPEAAEMLTLLASLRFTREVQTATTAGSSAPFNFTAPESRLNLNIPAGGFVSDTSPSASASPRYFKLTRSSPNLIISGWFEPSGHYKGMRDFWAAESKALAKTGLPPVQNVTFSKTGNWEIVAYDLVLPGVSNSNLRAELNQAGTWIDLHLSITSAQSARLSREQPIAFIQTILVSEK